MKGDELAELVKVVKLGRSSAFKAEIQFNGCYVCGFDSVKEAEGVAENLRQALRSILE